MNSHDCPSFSADLDQQLFLPGQQRCRCSGPEDNSEQNILQKIAKRQWSVTVNETEDAQHYRTGSYRKQDDPLAKIFRLNYLLKCTSIVLSYLYIDWDVSCIKICAMRDEPVLSKQKETVGPNLKRL